MASKLSSAEEVFVGIFSALYGEHHRAYLLRHHNFPFIDTLGGQRYMDFALFTTTKRIAIEIEGEAYHNPAFIEPAKYSDDLSRANAQVIAGWFRLSFTPRTLFEGVETVKAQLRAVLGDNPTLLESSASPPIPAIGTPMPLEIPPPEGNGIINQSIGNIFQTPHVKDYAWSKMRPAMTSAIPTAAELLDYSIARNVPGLLDSVKDLRLSQRDHAIKDLDHRHPKALDGFLRPIADTLAVFSTHNATSLLDWHFAMAACMKPILAGREAAFSFIEQFINCLYNANCGFHNDVVRMQDSFSRDRIILRYLTDQLAAAMAAASAAYLPQRQALIRVRDGRNAKVTLSRKQTDSASNGFEFPNKFYESCIEEIVGLGYFPTNILNRLLMGDSTLNATNHEASSLPATPHELTGHLQDTVYLCFNHGLINRYYVETEPCEFVINSYNIKTITTFEEPANDGIILLWFKIKYTDESVELGMTILDPGHKDKCRKEDCAINKYDLQFYVEYSSNKNTVVNPQKFINAAKNMGKIMPIIAACYRDLNVLEVETRSYSKSRKQVPKPKVDNRRKEYWTKVVWVPRKKIYYDRDRLDQGSPQFKRAIEELVPTMIMGHLRRCENPNPKQLELAHEFGIRPPIGYTFVRPHSRNVQKAELTRFRSKSALEILYGQN